MDARCLRTDAWQESVRSSIGPDSAADAPKRRDSFVISMSISHPHSALPRACAVAARAPPSGLRLHPVIDDVLQRQIKTHQKMMKMLIGSRFSEWHRRGRCSCRAIISIIFPMIPTVMHSRAVSA
jgi:hypothetical protein